MADYIDNLIARFIRSGSKYAELISNGYRMILKRQKSRSDEIPPYQLVGVFFILEKQADPWTSGATSMTIDYFETKEGIADWIKTEEGVDRVKDAFNLLHRVADKDPEEDWDW